MKFPKFLFFFLSCLFALSLAACSQVASPDNTESPAEITEPLDEVSEDISLEPAVVSFSKKNELLEYIYGELDAGNTEVTFRFNGKKDILDPEVLAFTTDTFGVSMEVDPDDTSLYTIMFGAFSGDRIVQAYFSGDESGLTEDEAQTLMIARDIVSLAVEQSADSLEIERAIHDVVCDKLTYVMDGTETHDPVSPPREVSVVGALLDGVANSYGYADTFYTLATMAGLKVDRTSVYLCNASKELRIYMYNTICIDGAWYAIDTCFNDVAGGMCVFNAGQEIDYLYSFSASKGNHTLSPYAYENTDWASREVPVITCLLELCRMCEEALSENITAIVFDYEGDDVELYDDVFFERMVDCNGSLLVRGEGSPNRYILYVNLRPGIKIVNAYKNNNTSTLTSEEKEVLQMALGIVEKARSKAKSDLELEEILYQTVMDMCIGSLGNTGHDYFSVRRIDSAIGAFLDGKCCCQGYADAFYLLASIAGFNVGKMVVEAKEGSHIVNTICLDGKWYIVDTAFYGYGIFNVGKNYASEHYTCNEYWEWPFIEEDDDPKYLMN